MKKIILKIVIICAFNFSNAQSPVIELYSKKPNTLGNEYYKDILNFQNQYIGTWLYTNGNTSLKIVFEKKIMFHETFYTPNYYEDLLIGGYQYIENGVEKVNTLANLSITTNNLFNYDLLSITNISKHNFPKCPECGDTERRMLMSINEPSRRQYYAPGHYFIVRKYTESGVDKIKILFNTESGRPFEDKITGTFSPLKTFTLPFGEYILTKVP